MIHSERGCLAVSGGQFGQRGRELLSCAQFCRGVHPLTMVARYDGVEGLEAYAAGCLLARAPATGPADGLQQQGG